MPDETQAYVNDTKALVLSAEARWRHRARRAVLADRGRSDRKALATEAGRQAARKALGDAFAVDDAAEMALLLSAGEAMRAIERAAARAGRRIHTNSCSGSCAPSMTSWSQRNPDAAPYVAVVAMNRLARPGKRCACRCW